uniref:No apical meristem-associated C-terminal domain-containing protein n=1 Tax=Glycine max TaxID=3847 RepID=A0A0R0FPB0_SOYBN
MLNAYVIWKEDKGTNFGLEHAWRLLKDQPKWLEQFTENCSKRTKISTFGAYSSSSNPETPVEADTLSPIICPMGAKGNQKEEQREKIMREINVVNAKLAALREKQLEKEYYDILLKVTSTMSETQLKDYEPFVK